MRYVEAIIFIKKFTLWKERAVERNIFCKMKFISSLLLIKPNTTKKKLEKASLLRVNIYISKKKEKKILNLILIMTSIFA